MDPTGEHVKVQKAGELVAERLRRRIINGDLSVGDRLPPEEELTAHFGVARTTLREALRILETQGLIEIRRGRGGGGVITRPKPDQLAWNLALLLQFDGVTTADLDNARQLIEPALARQLAARHSDDDVAALTACIEAADIAADAGDVTQFAIAAARVHETIIERSGNVTLATLSNLLHLLVQHYYEQGARRSDQALMRRAVRSYRKLLALVIAGDAKGAETHWRKQMATTLAHRDPSEPLQM
jgi:DNA-binding FadR family transcriptional regulator